MSPVPSRSSARPSLWAIDYAAAAAILLLALMSLWGRSQRARLRVGAVLRWQEPRAWSEPRSSARRPRSASAGRPQRAV